jgi:hypothetical protein
MEILPAHLDIIPVAAFCALLIGGAVRVSGSQWMFTALRFLAGFAMRRRGASTALLGATASAGLAAASALGVQPLDMGDAVSWFQTPFLDAARAAERMDALPE